METKNKKREVLVYPFDNLSVEVLDNIWTSDVTGTTVHKVLYNKKAYILKLLSRKHLNTESKVKHAFEEKAILADLDHPQMPKLIKTCKDQHHIGLLMTLQRGLPLNKLVAMTGAIPLEPARLMVFQVAKHLEYLHRKGILYRDLKLSNILVSSLGVCSLIDFGLAKRIGKERTNSICGTAHTLPKELHDPAGYSYPLDYFTLGVVAFELLAAKFPFPGLDTLETIKTYDYSVLDLSPIEDFDARSFIGRLLDPSPASRLGAALGICEILDHPFLAGITHNDDSLEQQLQRLTKEHKILFEDVEMGELTDTVDEATAAEAADGKQTKTDPFAGFF